MERIKNKLLAVNNPKNLNIGDYIQALASSQFYPCVDGFIQREALKEYDGDQAKMIMNGWYMENPSHWPPSEKISPLFVAFHINVTRKDQILTKRGLEYLKRHEPIGCRDTYTRDLLQANGVDAYFSGCMTLTLGYKYKQEKRKDLLYFVEPYLNTQRNIFHYIPKIGYFLKNIKKISIVSKKWYGHHSIKSLLKSMLLLETYSQMFSESDILSARFVSQAGGKWPESDEELLGVAEQLVKEYAQASLVVTSRIHCALPCLGLETPVLFTVERDSDPFSSCRFGGLKELFNVIEWENGRPYYNFPWEGEFTPSRHPSNKTTWKILADSLKEKCNNFLNNYVEMIWWICISAPIVINTSI